MDVNALLTIYRNSPNVYSLYTFLKNNGATYIILCWNIVESTWYIPLMYNKIVNDEFDFEGWYVNSPNTEITVDQINNVVYNDIANQLDNKINNAVIQAYKIKCANSRAVLFTDINININQVLIIVELFIMRIVEVDIHMRYKSQQHTLIKYMHEAIKVPLHEALKLINLMTISNTHSQKYNEASNINNQSNITNTQILKDYMLLQTLNTLHIGQLNKSIIGLSNSIFDIIDLSQLELGKFKIEKHTFHLHNTIHDIINIAKSMNHKEEVSIEYYIEPNVPLTIFSDAKRIKQIIISLMDNAIRFTNKGEISLHVYASVVCVDKEDREDRNNTTTHTGEITTQYDITFLVNDGGCGMNEQTIRTLFKPSMITHTTTCKRSDLNTESIHHYGLSLRIGYLLAKYLHGNLSLQRSEIDRGSCFNFSIVAYEDEPNPINTQTIKLLNGRKVLIIDHTLEKNTIINVLDKYRLVYNVAATYDDMKLLIPTKTYDVIFINTQFPIKISWQEFMTKIRQIQHAIFINLNEDKNKQIPHLVNNLFESNITIPATDNTYKCELVSAILTMPTVP